MDFDPTEVWSSKRRLNEVLNRLRERMLERRDGGAAVAET